MSITPNSLAAAVGASAKNVQFQAEAQVLQRKILVIGTYDPAKTDVTADEKVNVLSPADAGDQFGFGSMVHRLVLKAWKGSNGAIPVTVVPQAEVAGAAAEFELSITVGTVRSGNIYLYIMGDLVTIAVTAGDTADDIVTNIAAAVNAWTDSPVDATADTGADKVTLVLKSKGAFWGEETVIALNLGNGEALPNGVAIVIAQTVTGTGTPDISDALDALGTDENANEDFYTDVVHGYGQVTAVLDAISTYVGEGNDPIALWGKLVHRPFRVLTGDTAAGSTGYNNLITLGDGRKVDRANGVIAVPGSQSHPAEIAAQAIGIMARLNNNRAEEHYVDQILDGVQPGAAADRWTSSYTSRDQAVKAGISPTTVKSGAVVLQNVVTFYHPDNVSQASNGYRSMRNISLLQNILYNIALNFEQEKWKGITIVEDATKVTSTAGREKVRDIDSVISDLVNLAESFEGLAWIYTASFTIGKLKEAGAVTIRDGVTGFDNIFSIILSGEGSILDTVVEFDTSIAILL